MKSLLMISSLLLTSSSFAAVNDAEKVMKALFDLGVREEGAQVSAMSGISFSENGQKTEDLSVQFSHLEGGSIRTVHDVKLFTTTKSSVLVITYQAEEEKDAIVTKTKIIPVNSEAAQIIAEVVKANSQAVDNSSSPKLKIEAYSVNSISCSRGDYRDATPVCEVK